MALDTRFPAGMTSYRTFERYVWAGLFRPTSVFKMSLKGQCI
jgi:hypothetical protein